jgi:hypothetical protein
MGFYLHLHLRVSLYRIEEERELLQRHLKQSESPQCQPKMMGVIEATSDEAL